MNNRKFTESEIEHLLQDANSYRAVLKDMIELLQEQKPITAADVLESICNARVEMDSVFPGCAWWEVDENETLSKWHAGEISEAIAAYWLQTDRIGARIKLEQWVKVNHA